MTVPMTKADRVPISEAPERIRSGALLVCAYEDDAKYDAMKIPGSISYKELEAKGESLDRTAEIIFYCG